MHPRSSSPANEQFLDLDDHATPSGGVAPGSAVETCGGATPTTSGPFSEPCGYSSSGPTAATTIACCGQATSATLPAGTLHAYRAEGDYAKSLGISTGGFERFFQALGTLTEARSEPGPFYLPSPEQMGEAFGRYGNIPALDHRWEE